MEGHFLDALEVFTADPQPRAVLHFDLFRLIEEQNMFTQVANQATIFALLTTHEAKVRAGGRGVLRYYYCGVAIIFACLL